MSLSNDDADNFFTAPLLYRDRYKVTDRTFYRWLAAGSFPPPDWTHNGRNYWRRRTVEQHERATMAARTSKQPAAA
jgi:hypothetical protein